MQSMSACSRALAACVCPPLLPLPTIPTVVGGKLYPREWIGRPGEDPEGVSHVLPPGSRASYLPRGQGGERI